MTTSPLRTTVLVVAAVATMAVLAGCSAGPSSAPHSAHAAPSERPAASSPTPSAAAPGASGPQPASGTITDPELGLSATVHQIVRNFPIPDRYSARSDRGDELVLLDVTLDATQSRYSIGMSDSAFALLTAPGGESNGAITDIVEDEMNAAGYAPLPYHDGVDVQKAGDGWMAFFVEPGQSPTLILRYHRGAAGTSDGTTIAAKDFDLPLVG